MVKEDVSFKNVFILPHIIKIILLLWLAKLARELKFLIFGWLEFLVLSFVGVLRDRFLWSLGDFWISV